MFLIFWSSIIGNSVGLNIKGQIHCPFEIASQQCSTELLIGAKGRTLKYKINKQDLINMSLLGPREVIYKNLGPSAEDELSLV